MLVGDTGTGKSSSIEKLNPEETFIINCMNKPLPFRGSSTKYNFAAKKNMLAANEAKKSYNTDDMAKGINALMNDLSSKRPTIKNIILDDAGSIMSEMFFNKAEETGYSKFTAIAKSFQSILSTAKGLRDDLNVVIVMHEEDESSNSIKVKKKVKTVGKLVDDQYNPLMVVSIALFTTVVVEKDNTLSYKFITNRTFINHVEIPAKSPRGMFPELLIPNDLELIFQKAREYYGEAAV